MDAETRARISSSQRKRYERERAEAWRLRSQLHAFALWISPVWDDENEDDVEEALRAVDEFLSTAAAAAVPSREEEKT